MDTLEKNLKDVFAERIKMNEPLANYTTMKIGGAADYFFEAKTIEELQKAVVLARERSAEVTILGGATNTLIGDRGIRGLVIKNTTGRIAIRGAKGVVRRGGATSAIYVEVDSGVIMNKLVRYAIEEGLAGLEMHLGLPGTVGGAVYMNSKWTHPVGYVGDVVYQATLLSFQNEVKVVPHSYFLFDYDTSSIQRSGDIVLTVVFALRSDTKEHLWAVANDSISYRRTTQPQGIFSLGCTFQNIAKAEAITMSTPSYTTSAGFLIDHAGLKGTRIGNAQISPVHANFIINLGGASARNVIELIDLARTEVKKKFGVILKEEIVRLGEF